MPAGATRLHCARRLSVGGARAPLTGSNHPDGFGFFFLTQKKAGLIAQSRESCFVAILLKKNGSGSWIRTSDQVVNSHLLYR